MAKEVNGYQLRESLKRWTVRKDVADKQFKESLFGFKDDESGRPTPKQIAETFQKADFAVAKLQEVQQDFNRQTTIEVDGKKMTLALAIKLVSGAGRVENMWRSAATDTGRESRYGYERTMSRKADEVYAQRRVKVEEAIKFSDLAAQYASQLRSAIATANGKTILIPADVPVELFE